MAQSEVNIDVHERLVKTVAELVAGTTTFAGRKDAWHKLGIVTGVFMTWRALLAAAHADFNVFKSQLRDGLGRPVDAWGTFRWDLEDKAVKDMAKAVFLGTVGSGYQVIQHTEGFELLDSLVGSIDGAHYETMGTLDKGRVVWGQVDPNVKIRVGDDESDILLTFQTSHDGSKAFEIYETVHRIVCRNTFKAANLRKLAASLWLKHTKNVGEKMNGLKGDIQEIQANAMDMQEKLNFLNNRRVTKDSMVKILDRIFPKSEDKDGIEKTSTRRDNILADVLKLYESNDGDAFPEQRGTMYNLLNAVTEYTDHFQERQEERKPGEEYIRIHVWDLGEVEKDALAVIFRQSKQAPEVLRREHGTVLYDAALFAK